MARTKQATVDQEPVATESLPEERIGTAVLEEVAEPQSELESLVGDLLKRIPPSNALPAKVVRRYDFQSPARSPGAAPQTLLWPVLPSAAQVSDETVGRYLRAIAADIARNGQTPFNLAQLKELKATFMAHLTRVRALGDFLKANPKLESRWPDLADIELHEIYEVKPDHADGLREGRQALRAFQSLLEQADREHLSLRHHPRYAEVFYDTCLHRDWRPGTSWAPKPAEVAGPAGRPVRLQFRNEKGVILWSLAK